MSKKFYLDVASDLSMIFWDLTRSTCYLADDFSAIHLPDFVIKSPEGLMNESQIIKWVKRLKKRPKIFATTSLFLLRELELQGANVLYVNLRKEGKEKSSSKDVDMIGNIEILDRELRQSDRYLKKDLKEEKKLKSKQKQVNK